MTYAQIAKTLSLSTERVRQIEHRAIAKLSHPKNKALWLEIQESLRFLEEFKAKENSYNKELLK